MQGEKPRKSRGDKIFNEMKDGGRGWLVRSECELAGRNKAGNEGDVRAIRRGDGCRKNDLLPF